MVTKYLKGAVSGVVQLGRLKRHRDRVVEINIFHFITSREHNPYQGGMKKVLPDSHLLTGRKKVQYVSPRGTTGELENR